MISSVPPKAIQDVITRRVSLAPPKVIAEALQPGRIVPRFYSDEATAIVSLGGHKFAALLETNSRKHRVPLPGIVRGFEGQRGVGLRIDPHGGSLIVEGGGSIGGDVPIAIFPDTACVFKGVQLRPTGITPYRIETVFVAMLGPKLTADDVADTLEQYLIALISPHLVRVSAS